MVTRDAGALIWVSAWRPLCIGVDSDGFCQDSIGFSRILIDSERIPLDSIESCEDSIGFQCIV